MSSQVVPLDEAEPSRSVYRPAPLLRPSEEGGPQASEPDGLAEAWPPRPAPVLDDERSQDEGGVKLARATTARSAARSGAATARAEVQRRIGCRRRIVRTGSLLCILGFALAVWIIAMIPYSTFTITKFYSGAGGLRVDFGSCDIELVPAAAPTVTYQSQSRALSHKWTKSGLSPGEVTQVDAKNKLVDACEGEPMRRCEHVCLLTVGVPADASGGFDIYQDAKDEAWPVITVRAGVRVARLSVGAWFARSETASIVVEEGAEIGSLTAKLQHGSLTSHSAAIDEVSFESKMGDGSVYLLGVPTTTADVEFSYRQPSNRVCLATDEPYYGASPATDVSWVPAADPLGNCDFRALLALGRAPSIAEAAQLSSWVGGGVAAVYDEDKDNLVTGDEFKAGLDKLTCCGGNCPFSSWCAAQSFAVGFGLGFQDGDARSSSSMSIGTFASNLLALNLSQWVPKCLGTVTMRHVTPLPNGGVRPLRKFSSLYTDGGEVRPARSTPPHAQLQHPSPPQLQAAAPVPRSLPRLASIPVSRWSFRCAAARPTTSPRRVPRRRRR